MTTAVHVRSVRRTRRARRVWRPRQRAYEAPRTGPIPRRVPAPRPPCAGHDVSILVAGPLKFAVRLIPRLGQLAGVRIVGHSAGENLARELADAGWPDLVIVDAGVGQKVGANGPVPELTPKGRRCGIVVVAGPEAMDARGSRPIKLWPHWSLVLEKSTADPEMLDAALKRAARGIASVDRSADEAMIEYLAVEPISPLSLIPGLHAL